MPFNRIHFAFVAIFLCSAPAVHATIMEVGTLNIIDDAGNPSDGLRYLDMSFSSGRSQADAITNAQTTYTNARVATASEFDDLFAAAGVSLLSGVAASDGFSPGPFIVLADPGDTGVGLLRSALGHTVGTQTLLWTVQDGSPLPTTSRDYVQLSSDNAAWAVNYGASPSDSDIGWLLVSETQQAPEPATLALLFLGLAGIGFSRRRAT